MHLHVTLLILFHGILLVYSQEEETCRLIGKFEINQLQEAKGSHLIIGGMFPIHFRTIFINASTTDPPISPECEGFNFRSFRWVRAMTYAIEEINRSKDVLPNITLGYTIYDTCFTISKAVEGTLVYLTGQDETMPNFRCSGGAPLAAVVGAGGSALSIATARIFGLYYFPQIGYVSSCSLLSDKFQFPSFLRTVPSDDFQSRGMAQLIVNFGWTWVGTIAADDDYGKYGIKLFKEEVEKVGVCISFSETLPRLYSKDAIQKIVDVINGSTANIIVVFSSDIDLSPLIEELARQGMRKRLWVASEAWVTSATIAKPEYFRFLGGILGFALRRADLPDFDTYLNKLHPNRTTEELVYEFWEHAFNCTWTLGMPSSSGGYSYSPLTRTHSIPPVSSKPCTGREKLSDIMNTYTDISQLRITYSVYKSVYTAAYALHNLATCRNGTGPFINGTCADIIEFEPWQAPRSVCSESCKPGTRKGIRQGEPVCCFDCIDCADGEITNETDARECTPCSQDYWSNTEKTQCVLKLIEFLAYDEALGVTLMVLTVFGACITFAVTVAYILHRDTPLVKSNDRELSFGIQFSIVVTFISAIIFIGKPLDWSCMTRQALLGLGFSLCLSCVLGKSVMLMLRARGAKKARKLREKIKAAEKAGEKLSDRLLQKSPEELEKVSLTALHQKIIACCGMVAQVCIVTSWLVVFPPTAVKNTASQNIKIIFECNEGSVILLCAMYGYDLLLAFMCLVCAFVARKSPDNFNEGKFVTFGMLVFFIVWISFVPAYLSTRGKFMVAVEIFAILASSYGLLGCIFAPKCYIILVKPARNTEEIVTGKAPTNDKSAPPTSASVSSEVINTTVSTVALDD
ncbi:vomeronasal type-2 receptor 1-like [Protopterus annectens]|uniref:vomeronasal type-2 receptor 1-like n=1 Tax=Protopterus annectens TaxID=7888 RepID=UPI001CFBB533|nr:vomeronasal type-2 receptor 1-like [Protopterus annectens]